MKWQEISEARQQKTLDKIPSEWKIAPPPKDSSSVMNLPAQYLSSEELTIVSTSAEEAIRNLQSGKWSSILVTKAVCHAAAVAHQLTNCLTDLMLPEAYAAASAADEHFAATKKPLGAFHGLPISLKDCFKIVGCDTSVGIVSFANDTVAQSEDESAIVKMLRAAGAILYCKTTTPTAMLLPETYSNLYGLTTNPYNTALTCGGSSGGEASLLALNGSLLGIGTDIGGSLRIPSAFCGLYTLKPTFGRFPTFGTRPSLPGQEAILSVNGPMGHSVADIQMYCKAMADLRPEDYDSKCVPFRWRSNQLPRDRKLTFGIVRNNGLTTPLPSIQRAVERVIEVLTNAGHETLDFEYAKTQEIQDTFLKLVTADGGSNLRAALKASGEPLPHNLLAMEKDSAMKADDMPVSELWKTHLVRAVLANDFMAYWNATEQRTNSGRRIDLLISPVAPYPAPAHYENKTVSYTNVYNLLGMYQRKQSY